MKKRIRGGLLFSLLLAVAASCSKAPVQIAGSETAPDFTLPLFGTEGTSVTLSELYRDQVVLLAFWASWCPTCVEEVPILNVWAKKYEAKGMKILGVNVQETPEEVKAFSRRIPLEFPVALDPEGKAAEQYGLVGLPVSLVIAKGGKIIYYGFSLPQKIEQLLEQSLPAGRQGVSG